MATKVFNSVSEFITKFNENKEKTEQIYNLHKQEDRNALYSYGCGAEEIDWGLKFVKEHPHHTPYVFLTFSTDKKIRFSVISKRYLNKIKQETEIQENKD